jgi:hypothetical protein
MVRHFDSRFAYSMRLQNDDCVICASISGGQIGKGYTKSRIVGMRTTAARMRRAIDFRHAYFHPIMMPVHMDMGSANAIAAKNIFVGSELGGGAAWDACGGFGISSFGSPGFALSDLPNWIQQPFGEEGKASPSYAIVRDVRGCWEVRRNCHERSRADRTSEGFP